jgi:hypothetical protein
MRLLEHSRSWEYFTHIRLRPTVALEAVKEMWICLCNIAIRTHFLQHVRQRGISNPQHCLRFLMGAIWSGAATSDSQWKYRALRQLRVLISTT